MAHLEFELPLLELEARLAALRAVDDKTEGFMAEIARLEDQVRQLQRELFDGLNPWEKVQLSKHPERPFTLDYVPRLLEDFLELHGDRRFADDAAIVAGLGRFRGRSIVLVGHQKGRTTKENMARNFGMPNPEGYRKAIRLFELADRFHLPVVTLIDTPGAYPGIEAEERGQAEAIGQSLFVLAGLRVPVVAVVIGEGGSGGALALGLANRVLMLEHATYSVISPAGCASILWKDSAKAPQAAAALKVTATDLKRMSVIDEVIPEPPGGAHREHDLAARYLGDALEDALQQLGLLGPEALVSQRYERFRRLGAIATPGA